MACRVEACTAGANKKPMPTSAIACATRSGGKPLVVRALKEQFSPEKVVAIGDGVSDLETKPEVDLFVGFGRYVARPRVEREAGLFIRSLDQLIELI